MGLSVVIPAYNVAATIEEQLSALLEQTFSEPWEILVVDNRSTDDTLAIVSKLAEEHPRIRIIRAFDRQGIGYARNTGARAARYESIAICDGDDIVGPGWLTAMGEALRDHDLVVGRLEVDRLNAPWLACSRGRPAPGIELFHGIFPRLHGCNHGFQRRIWADLGGFDETFTETVEDHDFSLRAWNAGYPVHYAPDAIVHYRYRSSLRSLWRQGRSYGTGRAHVVRRLRRLGYRPPLFPGWKSWLWLLVSTPLAVTPHRFKRWVWVLANRLGQLEGSVRYRVLYL